MAHTRKVLSQAGVSLADVYDIEGSIVGIDALDVEDIKGVHDLGPQIFSERALSFTLRIATGDIAQTLAFDSATGGLPDSPNRLIGISVLSNFTARISTLVVSLLDSDTGREWPIWAWDETANVELPVRWNDDGGGTVTAFLLDPGLDTTPLLLTRFGDARLMPQFVVRGLTTTFGAGTVEAIIMVHLCRANRGNPAPGAPSSHGLPIPSW